MENYKDFLPDSSRAIAEMAANLIGENEAFLREVVELCFNSPYPYCMRASRVLQIYAEQHPEMLYPFLEEMIPRVINSKVSGVRRNILKLLYDNISIDRIPNQALLLNTCFDYLTQGKEPIALRYYALKLLLLFSERDPEIFGEILLVMQELDLDSSKGLKNYWGKILRNYKRGNLRKIM